FRRLQTELPEGLARLDAEMDELMTGFLLARGVPHRRIEEKAHVRYELEPSESLPDGWRMGGIVAIGDAKSVEDADPLHLGHPLVRGAVEEARDATGNPGRVAWILDGSAPAEL